MSSLETCIMQQSQRLVALRQRLIQRLCADLADEFRSTVTKWIQTTKLAELFPNIISAIHLRDAAKEVLLSIKTLGIESSILCNDMQVVCYNLPLTLECARHITLTAYVSHTWALFDMLSNIAGRIIGNADIAGNRYPRNNAKLYEGFLKKSNRQIDAFSLDGLIRDVYGEYICASYDIRNTILHDGGFVDTRQLLSMDLAFQAFDIDERMVEKLNNRISKKFFDAVGGDVGFQNVNRFEFEVGDVRHQIVLIDEKLTELLDQLLEWGVNSFESQVRTFMQS